MVVGRAERRGESDDEEEDAKEEETEVVRSRHLFARINWLGI
jgi:hypothetical protein